MLGSQTILAGRGRTKALNDSQLPLAAQASPESPDSLLPALSLVWSVDLLGRLLIDHWLESSGLLDRQIGRIGTFQDLLNVMGNSPVTVGAVRAVCHEPAAAHL
jgi:hypothetical protein